MAVFMRLIPELGNLALILAFCLALLQAIIPLVGAQKGWVRWIKAGRPLTFGQFIFMLMAILSMEFSLIFNDFSVKYVAENSNTLLPLMYRIAALWGGHEGSLLLWSFILSVWTLTVAYFSRSLPDEMVARVLGVLGFISVGFLLFLLATSNPFARLLPQIPINGRDLNPLLQDPGLIIHPPMLYMGYVGFSVAFAFAISALIGGRLDAAWARWSRPWTLAAWCFLTLGIVLGSWWAYSELGWGGWWFWDPVENASFLPWLVGTALLHSLAVTEKRSAFKGWTVLLAICAFALCLLGTFLVRSGVLTSVHAFASDPERGVYMLVFLLLVLGSSLTLYAIRMPRVVSYGSFRLLSKETLLLGNNLLLTVAAFSVLLGTLYPLLLDGLRLGKISVGPPYFNAVFIPMMVPLLFLMGIGPNSQWSQQKPGELLKKLYLVAALSLSLGILLPLLITGSLKSYVVLSVILALWIILSQLQYLLVAASRAKQGWRKLPRSHYGMVLAHTGVAITLLGIALTSAYSIERDIRMAPGNHVQLGKYEFTFLNTQLISGPNYKGTLADFAVTKDNKTVTTMQAEKRIYTVSGMPMTEASIDIGLFRDLYIALGEPLTNNAWAIRLYEKPFVRWIWGGGLLMMLGGALAATDRRYRKKRMGH